MQFTAAQIAALINAKVEGNPDAAISDIARIEEGRKEALSFVANPKYEHYLYETKAGIIIINETLVLERPIDATLLRVPDAYAAFAALLEKYNEVMAMGNVKKGIEQPSFIDATAQLGNDVYVGAFAYLGRNVKIGNNVKIFPHAYVGDNVVIDDDSQINAGVKIYHQCKLGKRVIVHAGTVIGADGFGFAPQGDGKYKKVPQLGNVVIEDDVEIGANTTIDRATIGSTFIRKGVKLDNLIQVAHNVEIGEGTVIASQTGISGSVKIGKRCMIGGQVGFAGHISIADGTKIGAQSGMLKPVVKEDTEYWGSPAFDFKAHLKSQVIFRNLPDLTQRIKQLEEKLNAVLVKGS
ncbi:UDP-3-O-(3-hydroxymyristoyl)glucosamine N-acyltransferase [Taibaiella lutea]|uniref:UDP-3-O-acylglucosamine N-acyltransferase n=1 Tax=Taibaiella lutea TaxID=2608001 RepID=A0A5M6CNW3_9BACT|nr:UDP-3-O-(3-hydroxymyristoyl)glucosamine N-acyltransferase [Taibaiella lutea]KAA5536777.1 UDP-3-O-(3-hydroxymyristoyl)glucosamine N-acyltransferase [Taibaiella lutea]